jgi:hypothetical protein
MFFILVFYLHLVHKNPVTVKSVPQFSIIFSQMDN